MKLKEIERAARETIVPRPGTKEDTRTLTALREGFKIGALYMKNALWHDADDVPDSERTIIAFRKIVTRGRILHVPIVMTKESIKNWDAALENFYITRWAYADDLMPVSFDEILNDNRDVLERIKEKGD